jgi:hypothetical protein
VAELTNERNAFGVVGAYIAFETVQAAIDHSDITYLIVVLLGKE